MDKARFKHRTELRVRNYEVDWQGIVHNSNYLLYFEVGRIEYLKNLRLSIDINSMRNDTKVVLARNEIDYKSPAMFDDLLVVHTRISYIRNTSFAFEGIIEESISSRRIAENLAIHVWLDPRTGEPIPVGEDFRNVVEIFEGGSSSRSDQTLHR